MGSHTQATLQMEIDDRANTTTTLNHHPMNNNNHNHNHNNAGGFVPVPVDSSVSHQSEEVALRSISSDYVYTSSDEGVDMSTEQGTHNDDDESIAVPATVPAGSNATMDLSSPEDVLDLDQAPGVGVGVGVDAAAYAPAPVSTIAVDVDSEEASGEVDREYTGQFEGPEKTLEVFFRRRDSDGGSRPFPNPDPSQHRKAGMRLLARSDLDAVCKRARCTILSSLSNQYLDAYVLSESSLFVYNYAVIIKTCGTTTLLRCLALLMELGRRLGLELDWVGYSRKNFNFPDDQCFPHGSFTQELEYLYRHKRLCEKLNGNGYTLGPITDDHWFVFVADKTVRSSPENDNDRVLNLMMFDFDPAVADLFYYDQYPSKRPEETEEQAVRRISMAQTKAAGIDALCPGALFDPRAFEPCGYSMNAILFQNYYTMHITPEEGSSYASFETNQKLASYGSLIHNVLRTFRPKRFVMTLMADDGGLKQMNPRAKDAFVETAEFSRMTVSKGLAYKRTNIATISVEDDCNCSMGNWTMVDCDLADGAASGEPRSRFMSFA